MSITLGVMLHLDRGVAAAVSPPQPVIEAKVVPQPSSAVSKVENGRHINSAITYAADRSPQQFQTYNYSGQQQIKGEYSGIKLDVFV